MTPQLQKEIANIQALSTQEQRQLRQLLFETVNKSDNLEQQNQFSIQQHPMIKAVQFLTFCHN